jgi:hypothetical protein
MLSLESSLSSVVVDGKFDVVREEEQVQDTRDIKSSHARRRSRV